MATLTEEVELLRKIPLFAAIAPAKLKLLAFASDVNGAAEVVIEDEENQVVVATLGKNEFIGEISILCEVPRTATIRAENDLETLKIKREHFLGLITQVPELGLEVMRELASRLTKTTAELGEAKRELSEVK